jgi:hypothetical protein
MIIHIETIPHKNQRYPTAGDWHENNGILHIKVSEELSDKEAVLVALHELIEVTLCKDRGISGESVDAFDMEYEKNRPDGDESEPGDDPAAPYRKEHFFATNVERLMASELGVDWQTYEEHVQALP